MKLQLEKEKTEKKKEKKNCEFCGIRCLANVVSSLILGCLLCGEHSAYVLETVVSSCLIMLWRTSDGFSVYIFKRALYFIFPFAGM
jgi:hypothetical protein